MSAAQINAARALAPGWSDRVVAPLGCLHPRRQWLYPTKNRIAAQYQLVAENAFFNAYVNRSKPPRLTIRQDWRESARIYAPDDDVCLRAKPARSISLFRARSVPKPRQPLLARSGARRFQETT